MRVPPLAVRDAACPALYVIANQPGATGSAHALVGKIRQDCRPQDAVG